jgi:TolB protein
MIRRLAMAAVLFLTLCCVVPAADVVVTKTGSGKSAIDVSGLRGAGGASALFLKTLETDLVRSGWFVISSPGQGGIVVTGSCRESGGSLAVMCDVRNVGASSSYLAQTFRGDAARARRLAHEVADEIVRAVKGVPGIACTRIAMVGARQGKKDLYVCDYDGQNLTQLTREGVPCLGPGWSPAGDRIVYMSFVRGYPDVYLIELANLRRTRISAYPGLNSGAAISPDGRTVALTLSKDGNPELYLMGLDGSRLTRLTRTLTAAEASPAWSPDGSQLVYVSDQSGSPQLYIISRAGGQGRRLTYRGSENVAPDWGPDGRIVCSSRQQGRYQICVIDPATGEPELLTSGGADHEDPSWAPNGRHIVYTRVAGYKKDLYVLDTMKDPEVRLLTIGGDWYSPSWSAK